MNLFHANVNIRIIFNDVLQFMYVLLHILHNLLKDLRILY
jgi:hypothetical protein